MLLRVYKNTVTQNLNQSKRYLKVGDKVPINYIKDAKPILIKEDKDYPEWVFHLDEKVIIFIILIFYLINSKLYTVLTNQSFQQKINCLKKSMTKDSQDLKIGQNLIYDELKGL